MPPNETLLSKQQRDMIKDAFKGFNTEFEEIIKSHKLYTVVDHEMKSEIVEYQKRRVVHAYTIFYDRYRAVNFTKNPEKHIKYLKEELSDKISRLFDSDEVQKH